jgi:multidrug efflux pump subunit AcrA (membrane-fusion protein)
VFVIADNRAQERIVTVGQSVDGLIEITTGLAAGDRVATKNVAQLVDGLAVSE